MKKILYTLLGMMLSVGAWAQTSLQDQINSAEAGTTVALSGDVTLEARIDINKNLTVDLGGHTITTTATCGNGSAFNIVSGTVTIQNGTIDASFGESNNGETDAITARPGSDVTLKNLNVTVKSKNGACAYAFTGSKITIKSGVYENQTTEVYEWNSNIKAMVVNQANEATQLIFIEGGTFKGYDPTLGDDSQTTNANATFLAEGVALQKDASGNYTTTTAVAKIGGKNYASLADAVAAATEGQTVTLLADINEAVENTNAHSFIIDLNGKTWTSNATSTFKNNGGTVTITDANGNGTIKNTANAKDMGIAVWARTGSVVIEKGTFISQSNYEATLYVGTKNEYLEAKQPTVTINGGTFKNTAEGVYKWNTNLLPLTLNVHNDISNADAYQAIVINGGTFYGDDPSIGDDSQLNKINKNSNFVSPELHAEKNSDGVFEIKEGGYVAQVGYLKYVTLAEAAAIADDKTITLLADATIETIDVVAGKTIAKNGYEITVNTFEVIDFATFNIPFDFTANTATYTRNVAGNEWGTVCVPFTLKSTAAIKLYEFGNIAGDVLTVNEIETAEPGTPVVFANTTKSTSVTFTTENASVSATAPTTTGTLIGTYTEQNITSGLESIYFINGDKFHQAKASLTVPAYRAYIQNTSAGAKAAVLSIVVDGEATAIEGVAADLNDTQAIYDVNGRQLSAPQKGINIMKLVNGKTVKLIIK